MCRTESCLFLNVFSQNGHCKNCPTIIGSATWNKVTSKLYSKSMSPFHVKFQSIRLGSCIITVRTWIWFFTSVHSYVPNHILLPFRNFLTIWTFITFTSISQSLYCQIILKWSWNGRTLFSKTDQDEFFSCDFSKG